MNGSWSNGTSGSGSCVTDADGECTITKNNVKKNVGSVTFTVTSVAAAGYGYDQGANHDPDGDSNGTVIVLTKP